MSDVTDILCAVSSGDFPAAASPLCISALALPSLGTPGTSGTGESALPSCTVEEDDSRLLSNDRDRVECESGRGVMSDASSKLSCRNPCHQQMLFLSLYRLNRVREPTHSFSVRTLRARRPVVVLFCFALRGHGGCCGLPDVQVKGSRSRCGTNIESGCLVE